MSRLREVFAQARREERAALITYLCAGDPDLRETPGLIAAAARGGADIVEVGVPFSDPTADGPAIQEASERALRAGTTLAGVLAIVREARRLTQVPILLFGYYNPVLSYGEARLAADAADVGVDGLLLVDLPPEECAPLRDAVVARGLDYVPLLAPTSNASRVPVVAKAATAFVYYVSLTGVTGAATTDLDAAALRAHELAASIGMPVAVGFGVRDRGDVARIARHADGVVVGSALVRAIHAAAGPEERLAVTERFVRELAAGTGRT